MRADARRNLVKILDAAAQVMAERGVNAPMELMARRAGVGVGTLYRRFPDRDALISALGEHYVQSLADALEEATAGERDAWNALRGFVLWAAAPGRVALAAVLAHVPQEAVAGTAEFAESKERWLGLLDGLVRRAQAEGGMRTDVTREDVVSLLNVFTCHPSGLPDPVAARPEKYLHLMLDGMAAHAATPLPGDRL
ncbi:TetR/AcrR family transcriptional regulator [Nonomuraea spiralis]|uniref:TetR/AcrR family transcriptional regulator n=1 Tax=Nonomuraea spiralis TaxID=46182 RepID=A0ABV5IMV5_9ACTN|nr:TetR/AcrR family transcriptional regulator [Nonomuraea spiralis]GGT27480.1 TetR family transcriptional regulator [Nonomuraea spiralis]